MSEQATMVMRDSPIGALRLRADAEGLRGVDFLGSERPPRGGSPAGPAAAVLRDAESQLAAYFAGETMSFDLPLVPEGTPFQREVWEALQAIPHGETISYGELARRIGRPGAARAVGLANGANPIPVIIPCHRVIGSSGKLVGYGGGLPIKETLLALERRQLTLR